MVFVVELRGMGFGFRSWAVGGIRVVGMLPRSCCVRFFRVCGSLKDCLGGVRVKNRERVSNPSAVISLRNPLRQERYCLRLSALALPLLVFEDEGGFLRGLLRFFFRSLPCCFRRFFFLRACGSGRFEQGSPGMPSGVCTRGGRSCRFARRFELGEGEGRRERRVVRDHVGGIHGEFCFG